MTGAIAAVATIGSAAIGAYGSYQAAKQNKKAAKIAAQGKTTTSSPYMADRINPVIPYIMSDAQRIYENRLRTYGMEPGDFSPIAAQLAGIPASYSGVGAIGGASGAPSGQGGMRSAPMPRYAQPGAGDEELMGLQPREGGPSDEQLAAIRLRLAQDGIGGGGARGGMNDLINYWEL